MGVSVQKGRRRLKGYSLPEERWCQRCCENKKGAALGTTGNVVTVHYWVGQKVCSVLSKTVRHFKFSPRICLFLKTEQTFWPIQYLGCLGKLYLNGDKVVHWKQYTGNSTWFSRTLAFPLFVSCLLVSFAHFFLQDILLKINVFVSRKRRKGI